MYAQSSFLDTERRLSYTRSANMVHPDRQRAISTWLGYDLIGRSTSSIFERVVANASTRVPDLAI